MALQLPTQVGRTVIESLTYLTRSDELAKTLIIGTILLSHTALYFIPFIFVMGYVVRMLRRISTGNASPPAFDRWGQLFVDGLKACLIWYFYLLIVLLNVFLIQEARTGGQADSPEFLRMLVLALSPGASVSMLVTMSTVTLTTVHLPVVGRSIELEAYLLLMLALYVATAGVTNFARTGRFRAGFNLGSLRPVLFNPRYAAYWLLFFVFWLASTVLSIGLLLPQAQGVRQYLSEHAASWSYGPVVELVLFVDLLLAAGGFVLLIAAFYVIGHAWTMPEPAVPDLVALFTTAVSTRIERLYWPTYTVTGKSIVLGTLLLSTGLLLLAVVVVGYLVQVLRYAMDERVRLPSFEDWRALLRTGVGGVVIWGLYFAVPCLLALLWIRVQLAGLPVHPADRAVAVAHLERQFTLLSYLLSTGVGGGPLVGQVSNFLEPLLGDPAGPPEQITTRLGVSGFALAVLSLSTLIAFAGSFVTALYGAFAALARFGTTGRVRDGVDVRALSPILCTPAYAQLWRRIVTLWLIWFLPGLVLLWTLPETFALEPPVEVGAIPVFMIAPLEALPFLVLLVLLSGVTFYVFVVTYAMLGDRWPDCCEASLSDSASRSPVASALRPRGGVLLAFFVLSGPQVALLWWAPPTPGVLSLTAAFLLVSYVTSIVLSWIVAGSPATAVAARVPALTHVVRPSGRYLAVVVGLWGLSAGLAALSSVAPSLYELVPGVGPHVLWLPLSGYVATEPPLEAGLPLAFYGIGLWQFALASGAVVALTALEALIGRLVRSTETTTN